MTSDAEGRLSLILQRELGSSHVRFVRADEAPEASSSVLVCHVPSGPTVVVTFDEAPADHEAKARRMEMIVDSFADLLTAHATDAARHHRAAAPARSLAGELSALAGRAGAMAALVVDARSPVVWGASDLYDAGDDDGGEDTDVARLYRKAAHAGLRFDDLVSTPLLDTEAHGAEGDDADESGPQSDELGPEERAELWRRVLLVRNALAAVRALPHVANLHKGEHLHETVRAPELSYTVRSFATIYMLLLVFERPFDELRAERSVAHALPTIERLVLALPPREPTPPMAGVGVMRIRRR